MNARRLFVTSCLALITTAMVFSIRGDIVDALSADFHLTKQQMGVILSPAFWGVTLSILVGGSLVDFVGMRKLLRLSSLGYVCATLLILFAPRPASVVDPYYSDPGFLCLYAGMLILGLSQGETLRSRSYFRSWAAGTTITALPRLFATSPLPLAFSQLLSESFSSTIGPREGIKRLELRQTCE